MRITILWCLFLAIPLMAFAQVNSNPFEIKSRLDSAYHYPIGSNTSNIFDVQHEEGKSLQAPIKIEQDSTSLDSGSDLVPEVGEGITDVDLEQNPFDVSHIPIRKSKLKKEADALKGKKKAREEKTAGSNAFIFWLNLLTALLLAIVINTQKGAIKKVSNAITNENVLKLIHREESKGISGAHLLLYVSFFINAAIFVYLILHNFLEVQGWKFFQAVFLGILGIYLLKHVFIMGLGRIFPIRKDTQLYGFTIQTFNIFLGILLIPLNLIIAFGPENTALPLIYFGLGVIGILVLLRTFRSFLIASTYIQSNLFHFLLYLCTFEILPMLLLIKIIGNFEIA